MEKRYGEGQRYFQRGKTREGTWHPEMRLASHLNYRFPKMLVNVGGIEWS